MTGNSSIKGEEHPLVNILFQELISVTNADNLSKYQERARFLVYRIPVWRVPQNNKNPPFIIEIADLSDDIKEQISDLSSADQNFVKSVVKEAVSLIFDTLDEVKRTYFHESVKDMLEVRFV